MKNPFRNRFSRWINRRIPRSDLQTFSQKNIFILPTGAGVVFGLLLVIMLLTGINYQNSLIYLSTFLLGAVFVGAMHQTHRNLSGLELTLVQPGEGFAGDDIPFRFRLKAGRDDAIAILLSCEESGLAPVHVHSGQSQDVTLPVHSAHRGYLRPDRVRIETRFPFGLLKAWSWLRPVSAGVVFPRPVPAPEAFSTVEDGEESAEARSVEGNDHADIRPWREGDLSQRVLWKRYARTGQMVVADWEGEQGSPYWLDFNAYPGADHELRLSYLAYLVNERGRSGVRFGLNLPGQIIEPDSGPAHTARCLRVLATWGEERPRDAMAEPHGTRKKQRETTSQRVAEGQA
ncbi:MULTISPECIES: DUF58 domain-containing protein [unclassified Marinobacter]|uniref:DUF58 domain-containing protein n=1 Tax=unclassified Marinobacter TaxID=83889 RepID=UPI001929548A|nr:MULTISPECIES: DUF58 domain-containing protein [unclassified Marinobacter]MBL3825634.1 DUF58 domain-containing protein [Marinobacter sp. MC3]MBL3894052.1 DUF58 domain-containing protein [Marinobacter sp. MW3]